MVKNKVLDNVINCNEDVESYCIQKAKECMAKGDQNLAKSWFLTASNLFPNSFTIRFERYLMARDEGNLVEACRHLNEIFSDDHSKNPNILAEMRKIVNSVMPPERTGYSGSSFYQNLFYCFPPDAQYKLLLTMVSLSKDVVESCRLMLLVMKKFPHKINDHISELMIMINQGEQSFVVKGKVEDGVNGQETDPDFFDRLLVFEVLPVIFSTDSNLTAPFDMMISLLDRTIQYYVQLSVIKKIVDEEAQTKELNAFDFKLESNFEEIFNIFGRKLDWDLLILDDFKAYGNFVSGVLLALFQRIQTYYQKLSSNSTSEESDGPIDLSSSNSKADCNQVDEKSLKHVFYSAFLLFLKCFHKYVLSTAGKLVLVEHGTSFKGDPLKKRKIYLKTSSPFIVTENSELQESLTVSMQCFELLNTDFKLQKEFLMKLQSLGMLDSRAYQMFNQDCRIYRGNHEECLSLLPDSATNRMRSCLQLVSSSLMSYNYPLALKYSIDAVSRLHRISENKEDSLKNKKESPLINSTTSGRQLFFVSFTASEILTYCIEVIIACLKDRVLLSVKPTDLGMGHLIVLTQYNWPKEVDLFLKCVASIRKPTSGSPSTIAKFIYPHFTDYIFNPDILEEFMALVNSDGIIIELKEQSQATPQMSKVSKSSKTMTTRRVGKNAKEEIKTALICQMRRSKLHISDSLFVSFILSHLKDTSWMP